MIFLVNRRQLKNDVSGREHKLAILKTQYEFENAFRKFHEKHPDTTFEKWLRL